MIVYKIGNLKINEQISSVQISDLFNENYTDLSNIISVDINAQKFATSFAISSFMDNKISAFNNQIDQLTLSVLDLYKKRALPLTDKQGYFYMPDGLSSDNETQIYRKLTTYIEPETQGALTQLSEDRYYCADNEFIKIV